MATLQALKIWHNGLPQQTKTKLYAGLGLATIGLLFIRHTRKNKVKKQENDESTALLSPPSSASSTPILPISPSRVFWCSYLLTSATWALTISSRFNSFCNKYIPRIMSHRFSKNFEDMLPPVPKTLSVSFQLGQLENKLSILETGSGSTEEINNLLLDATKLLNRHLDKIVNSKQLHGVLKRILSIENQSSMISRIRGIFSFINIIWFFSILGISLTVIPVIYHLGKPLWDEIYNFCRKFFNGTFIPFMKSLLFNPTAYTIYEFGGYFMCWYFMYLGYESKSTIGFFTSFTGLSLWIPMQWISLYRHEFTNDRSRRIGPEVGIPMLALLSSALSIPLAYNYNSKLLGLTSIAGLYSYLGFFVHGFFGGYIVGFQGDEAVKNSVVASLMFNAVLISAKLKNIDLYPYRMFIGPTLTMSNIALFLALLIHTSEWRYWRSDRSKEYWQRQGLMIGGLAIAMAAGNILNYSAMSRTAYVFSGLYALQKMAESPFLWRDKNIWFSIFGTSIVGWRLALYLHKNPEVITGMVKFE